MASDDIKVDVSGAFNPDAIGPLADALKAKWVATLGAQAKSEWVRVAQANLKTMRGSYISAISEPEIDDNQAVVVLAGSAANRVEQGYAAYDMHDTLLGDKVPVVEPRRGLKGKHRNKMGGFYRSIPLSHSGPTSMGETGAPMGSAYAGLLGDNEAQKLGKRVLEMAKALTASPEKPGGGTFFGKSLGEGLAPKLKPHHKSDIYAGMYRIEKQYDKVKQYTYKTFRTISSNSPGWRVDAQPGKHFAQQVADFIAANASATFEQVCAELESL